MVGNQVTNHTTSLAYMCTNGVTIQSVITYIQVLLQKTVFLTIKHSCCFEFRDSYIFTAVEIMPVVNNENCFDFFNSHQIVNITIKILRASDSRKLSPKENFKSYDNLSEKH